MARFGSKVTVFAKSAEILGKEDRDAAAIVYKQLQADGVVFKMNAKYHMVKSGGPQGQEIHIQLDRLHEDQGKVTLSVYTVSTSWHSELGYDTPSRFLASAGTPVKKQERR